MRLIPRSLSGQPAQPRRSRHRADAAACGRSPARDRAAASGVRNQQSLAQVEPVLAEMRHRLLWRWPARPPAAIAEREKPARASRGFSAQRRIASRSLTCAASINLSPAIFDERGCCGPPALDLQPPAMVRGAEQDGLVAQIDPGPRGAPRPGRRHRLACAVSSSTVTR